MDTKTREAETTILAHDLIETHLPGRGWTFAFDRATSRAGCCKFGPRQITLSRPLLPAMTDADVLDTLLHEIAHAIAGPRANHGPEWYRVAIRIGCSGERCHELDTSRTAKYVATCDKCGRDAHWQRQPSTAHLYRCGRKHAGQKCRGRLKPEKVGARVSPEPVQRPTAPATTPGRNQLVLF